MDRRIAKLSAATVKAAKPGMHGDGGGLWLHVSGRGSRSWIFRFTSPVDGKPHEMGIGALHTVSLAEARLKALKLRQQVLEGGDPLADRQARRQASRVAAAKVVTFKECGEAYIAEFEATWRNPKHRGQWTSTLATYVYPVIGGLPVQSIDTGLVLKVIQPIWATKTETASRIRGRIEAVLDWATVHKYRTGDNPARWRGLLDKVLPEKGKLSPVAHHAALAYAEIGDFVAALRQREGIAALGLQFLILTAARTGEVIGATWSEIDLEGRLWAVPAGRMKAGREHRVPLSDAAAAILERVQGESEDTQPGDRIFPISNMALLALLGRMGRGDLTAHGFRSSFSDWAAERTAFPAEVREMALAHTVGDKVEAAYRRGELLQKRRQLAEAWARFCTTTPEPASAGRIVTLRQAAR